MGLALPASEEEEAAAAVCHATTSCGGTWSIGTPGAWAMKCCNVGEKANSSIELPTRMLDTTFTTGSGCVV